MEEFSQYRDIIFLIDILSVRSISFPLVRSVLPMTTGSLIPLSIISLMSLTVAVRYVWASVQSRSATLRPCLRRRFANDRSEPANGIPSKRRLYQPYCQVFGVRKGRVLSLPLRSRIVPGIGTSAKRSCLRSLRNF